MSMTVEEFASAFEKMLADDLAWICENQRRIHPFLAHLSNAEIIEAMKVASRAQADAEESD